jgi:hypothetical protein
MFRDVLALLPEMNFMKAPPQRQATSAAAEL